MILETYPMGPSLKSWLNLTSHADEDPSLTENPEAKAELINHVLNFAKAHPLNDAALYADLMEELLAMDLPLAVLQLADLCKSNLAADFRATNAEGLASMMIGEGERAKNCFSEANAMNAEEPGPYTNMSKIFLDEGDLKAARMWAEAGISANKNHFPLWEVLYAILQASEPTPLHSLSEVVFKHKAWAGALLLAELYPNPNPRTKLDFLDEYYFSGERSSDFLIEYTAALGIAAQFEKIPPIVWQAEKAGETLNWRLYVHLLQAILSMDQHDEFLVQAKRVIDRKVLPEGALTNLQALVEEIAAEKSKHTEGSGHQH